MNHLEQNQALSVTALNEYIDALMQADPILEHVHVRGEISNFKRHASGHLYFSLKDDGGVLRCVMFRSSANRVTFDPREGDRVIVRGNVGVYSATGQYQLYVQGMEPDGIGDLYRAFELLKKKLDAEGLFAQDRKKLLPRFPKTIGVVTSPTGAAIQDMLNILSRRYPLAEVILYPSLVQGADAPRTLCAGIRYFNARKPDVIIIGRGGGSIEDLWCFNDENLAREIAASNVPVISAVGHEIDYTICDFVADLRAPTPSAAAELAVPNMQDLLAALKKMGDRAKGIVQDQIRIARLKLDRLSSATPFKYSERILYPFTLALSQAEERLSMAAKRVYEDRAQELSVIAEKLTALNPMAVLSRGYLVAISENGRTLSSCKDFYPDSHFTIQLSDGRVTAKTITVEEEM
jgi:exodeoxyribonuclease VII large subunit